MDTRAICEAWYYRLGFKSEYDAAFHAALDEIPVPADATIEEYDLEETDGRRNLLYFLYFCEALAARYREKGIEEEVLLNTLRDIVIWSEVWSREKGELYLGTLDWLRGHLSMELFRIGALEYKMAKAPVDLPAIGVRCGEPILEVHIPHGSPFTREDCLASLRGAKDFFARHYPDFAFSHFTCHSWLLDPGLRTLLREGSNILGFAELFTLLEERAEESYAAIRYVFNWGTTMETLAAATPTSGFASRMKEYVLAGGKLYIRLGAIAADRID